MVHSPMSADSANPTPSSPPPRPSRWRRSILLLLLVAILAGINLLVRMKPTPERRGARSSGPPPPEAPAELSFAGSSSKLRSTVVVPTLETPVPPGKSAIWCATLPMAWQHMENKLIRQPIKLEDGKLGTELTNTPLPALRPEDYYLAAGLVKEGIGERIRRELAAKFPDAPLPDIPAATGERGVIALAYLHAAVVYKFQFKHSEKPLTFTDSDGRKTPVHAFGIREKDKNRGIDFYRGQVKILFRNGSAFALDLCKDTDPYEVVVARLERKDTLKATLADINAQAAEAKKKDARTTLGDESQLLVPSMNWRITHDFNELREKKLLNPDFAGWYIERAFQLVQFRLNRNGAEVKSFSHVTGAWNGHEGGPNASFIFDRPFLLALRVRADERPFFVVWIENAELLQRHE